MDSSVDPKIEDQSELHGSSFEKEPEKPHQDDSMDPVFHLNEYIKQEDADADRTAADSQILMALADSSAEPTADEPSSYPADEDAASSDSKDFHVVSYDPDKKVPRLGRPRRHGLNHLKASEDDASKNLEESSVSRFRFDDKPVEGPGSRGGNPNNAKKQVGRITSESLRKKKQKQSTLNFSAQKLALDSDDKLDSSDNDRSDMMELESTPAPKSDSVVSKESTPKVEAKKPAPKRTKPKTVLPVSRTTVINGRHKITRQFPGPIVPLYYDLYDDNVIDAAANKETAEEQLAFGFPVERAPFASDIIFLVSYLQRFQDIIGLGQIGPVDLEEGLCLYSDPASDAEPPKVSFKMIQLFARLTTLVLNRKPEVNPKFQGKPIMELKAVCVSLGLPSEWKDPEEIFERVALDPKEFIPVDEKMPDILLEESYAYHQPLVFPNPFTDKFGFEKLGFQGIEDPVDRLIMLRTLAQWSLISCNEIKTLITTNVSNQDFPGDKETYYGARSIMKGFEHTEDVTNETNAKIAKKNYKPDNEMVAKYVEPTSDPIEHNMRLRLNESVVGDCGFHIGRFYFVRAADGDNGGLTSVKKMRDVLTNVRELKNKVPSKFKLYVQDIHSLLTEGLEREGLEFDEAGNEVETKSPEKDEFFYEVASNVKQLEQFVELLEVKLDQMPGDASPLLSNSPAVAPTVHLYEFLSQMLPLLKHQESLQKDERSSRKRSADTEPKAKKARVEHDYVEEDFDEELEEVVPHDDEDDEDYMDG